MDDQQEPTQAPESDELAPTKSMMDRLRDAVRPEPSTDDAATEEPGAEAKAEAEAEQRALEDEFWGKK